MTDFSILLTLMNAWTNNEYIYFTAFIKKVHIHVSSQWIMLTYNFVLVNDDININTDYGKVLFIVTNVNKWDLIV